MTPSVKVPLGLLILRFDALVVAFGVGEHMLRRFERRLNNLGGALSLG